jgi:hypothetical protein
MSPPLERRYRRLLAWYPAPYRQAYEDEMLGVLMSSSGPSQRFPRPGDSVDLLRSALAMRLGRFGSGLGDRNWVDAAAVFAVLAPMALVAQRVWSFLGGYLWTVRLNEVTPYVTTNRVGLSFWGPVAAWAAVTIAVLLGWRLVAAAGAWLTVLAEAVALGMSYPTEPVIVLNFLWLLVFGATAAVALTVRAPRHQGVSILGWRKTTVFAAVGVLYAVSSAIDPLTARVVRQAPNAYSVDLWPGGGGYLPFLFDSAGLLTLIAYAIIGVATIVLLARIDPPVRRRILVLVAPTAVLIALIGLSFSGFAESSVRFTPPVLLVPAQWAVLVLAPVVAFLAGVLLIGRRERRLQLIQLGEAAERQNKSP